MSPRLRNLLPTGALMWALLPSALVFIATALDRNYATDVWHHLARGRAMAEHGTLIDQDLFTYTVPGKPFQDNNWLSQLAFYGLYCLGGFSLVQTVNSLVLSLTVGGLVYLCWRKTRSVFLSSALAVFAFFGLWQLLIVRPQTFSFALFVALYGVLEASDRRRWWLLVPPVLLALWANLHGGFPIGLVLVGCYLLAACWEARREHGWRLYRDPRVLALGLCLAACCAATLVNPYGWHVWEYVRTTSATAQARRIDEWVAPGLNLLVGKVWVLSVLLVLVLFALPKRRPKAREVILVLCFLPLACGSVRMVAWWLLVSTPVAAALLADNLPKPAAAPAPEQPSAGAALFVALLLAVAVLCAPVLDWCNPLFVTVRSPHRDEQDLQAIADRLAHHDGARRIFSRFEWGEYLGWALAPQRYTVFMDGRIEIFPDETWDEYSAVTQGRADWEEILDRHGVDCLLLDSGYHAHGLLPLVEKSPHWQPAGKEGKAVLFLRQTDTAALGRMKDEG
jgi:hypothetical protein